MSPVSFDQMDAAAAAGEEGAEADQEQLDYEFDTESLPSASPIPSLAGTPAAAAAAARARCSSTPMSLQRGMVSGSSSGTPAAAAAVVTAMEACADGEMADAAQELMQEAPRGDEDMQVSVGLNQGLGFSAQEVLQTKAQHQHHILHLLHCHTGPSEHNSFAPFTAAQAWAAITYA
jgi:hypothetical protein